MFESDSRLIGIESSAFSFSSLRSIEIPRNIEILGSSCFSWCQSLSSISFESNSRLNRIESKTFSSSLESIEIPSSVQFIDGSAFSHSKVNSISIESGNDIFVFEHEFLVDVLHHKLIRNFSMLTDAFRLQTFVLTSCQDVKAVTAELGWEAFSEKDGHQKEMYAGFQ
jgi:hypothetical protein